MTRKEMYFTQNKQQSIRKISFTQMMVLRNVTSTTFDLRGALMCLRGPKLLFILTSPPFTRKIYIYTLPSSLPNALAEYRGITTKKTEPRTLTGPQAHPVNKLC